MQWNSFLQRGTSLFSSSRFTKWKKCPFTSISGVRKNEVSEDVLERSRQYLSNIPSDYEKLLQVLYSINTVHPVSYSLANSEQLYEMCQRPMDNIPTIHITGTNGKGSIGIKLSKFFETEVSAVQKTGLFVSPHISCFRERIQINSQLVTQKEVELLLPELLLLCREHGIPATFFELTTMLSFLCFQKRNCEVVVLEVGMGGRLDATNVIPSPCIAIVSSIQLDHTHVLGTTREQIAREKSGIVKQFCPVLLGPDCELEIFCAAAISAQAGEVHTVNEILHHSMDIRHQYSDTDKLNADIARAAIQILATPPVQRMEKRIPQGLATIDKNELLFRQKSSFLQQALDGVSNERRHESTAFLCRPPCRMEEFFVYNDGAEFQNGLDHAAANAMYKGMQINLQYYLGIGFDKNFAL
jgi:folylpolyglutamate synthase/dihydrofolate synthase